MGTFAQRHGACTRCHQARTNSTQQRGVYWWAPHAGCSTTYNNTIPYTKAPAVSATTRRRATARAAGELHKAALCVEGALNDLQRLQRVAATHSGRVANLSGRWLAD